MKAVYLITALLIAGAINGCKKDDSPKNVNSTVQEGSWRITYFWDTDHDETVHFSGYSFTFGDDGILTASNGTNTYAGTWGTRTDDSQTKMDIVFTSPADFEELSDDWHVTEVSDSKINLEDVSGGDGGTDYLTFEKN